MFQCPKRHIFLCPEEDSKGICKQTRCPYPHKKKSQSSKLSSFKLKRKLKPNKTVIKPHPIETNMEKTEDNKLSSKRYFTNELNYDDDESIQCDSKKRITKTSASTATEQNDDGNDEEYVIRRTKIGTLPSFIPIG